MRFLEEVLEKRPLTMTIMHLLLGVVSFLNIKVIVLGTSRNISSFHSSNSTGSEMMILTSDLEYYKRG